MRTTAGCGDSGVPSALVRGKSPTSQWVGGTCCSASDDDDDDTGTPQKKKTTRERLLALWKQGELVVNDRERWRRATAEPLGFKVGEDVVRGGAARARAVWRGLEESNDVAAALQFLKSDIPSALDASKTPRETLRLVLDHFKREFPYYRDTCSHCGARGTEFIGEVACTSSDEAIRSRASRAELRSCSECGSLTRFVRSNAVETILAEKRGRCGEYATAFLAILFALRVEGRWIFDTTDHVWVEANIGDTSDDSSDTWIHCDPCEAALNEPLLYSANWGKKGSLVVGFSNDSATDLTPKYYPDTEQVGDGRKRDELSDDVIQSVLRGYGASGEIASSSRGGAASSSLPAAASSSSVPGGSDAPDASTKPVAAPEVAKAR
mmetsp:Transcript_5112/g.20999  ORF Transcript_5112/g.20999 Transcript_5112/m.20999 type:complete len:380 (-) Transcript_5112:218-1357(-)